MKQTKLYLLVILMLLSIFSTLTFAKNSAVSSPKKERTITLWGHVKDSFTKVGVKDVKIALMTSDSTIVDSCTVWRNSGQPNDFCYNFQIPAKQEHYIIRATHPDYYDTYVKYHVKNVGRNRYFDAPWHYMKRRSSTAFEGGNLDEVTVKATRIKIAYRGDTVVYDASAFKIPDGSMLDALVRQLPGAELKDDGSILVNGKKIDYLTLNGKDFFKGKNKMMLDNLPYFTVQNIKVYNRTTDFSKFMGKDVEQKEYVMDVNLKKEYSTGYLANVEAGMASSDRYLGRVFGSRFSDHTKITAFVNLNNINETRNPENNGDWRASEAPEGKTTNRSAGLNIQSDGAKTMYKNEFNANASWNDYSELNSTQSTRFMPTGDAYALSDNHESTRNRQFEINNNFNLQLPVWIQSNTIFRINDTDSRHSERNASLTASTSRYGEASEALDSVFASQQPLGIQESLVNRNLNNEYYKGKQTYAYQRLFFNGKLPWGDNLELEVNGEYNKRENKTYADYRLDYMGNQVQRDYRNIFMNAPTKIYRWEARAEYYINALNHWTWRIYTLFNQQNANTPQDYYRLDKLKEWSNGLHPLGEVPSTADSLLMARSFEDSQYVNLLTRNSQSGLHFYYNKQTDSTYTWIRFLLPLYVRNEKFSYQHAQTDTCATRTRVFMDGNVNTWFAWKNWKRQIKANFSHSTILPEMSNMTVYDDSDPLAIQLANQDLETTHKWTADMEYQHIFSNNRWTHVGFEGEYQSRPVVMGYRYNRQTGAYTYQYQNADCSWNTKLSTNFTGPFDKQQIWAFDTYAHISWAGSQVMQLAEGKTQSQLFDIRSLGLYTRFAFYYRKGDLSTSINGNYSYNNYHYQQGIREDYHLQNCDLTYSINYTIPVVKLFVGTTFTWNHLENSLSYIPSQNYYVWNAFVSRSFLKSKRLTAKLTTFDMLNSVTNYLYNASDNSFEMNTRDRIGRYVMLSMSYRINVNPKK